jgi:hypothetical protein
MLAGVIDNSPARLAEPAGAASKIDISQADMGQTWNFAPTMQFQRMRIVLRVRVDREEYMPLSGVALR